MATYDQAQIALEQYSDQLQSHPAVVGTGIVPVEEKIPGQEYAVAIYVGSSDNLQVDLATDDLPDSLEITEQGEAILVPVRVLNLGEVLLQ